MRRKKSDLKTVIILTIIFLIIMLGIGAFSRNRELNKKESVNQTEATT